MSGMPPTVGFNMPLGSVEGTLKTAGRLIKQGSGLAAARQKAAKKAAKLKSATTSTPTGDRTFIPLTQNRSLPIRPGSQPRPVVRGSNGGKFESNPSYGKWKNGMRDFRGNLEDQRIVQKQVQPDIGHVQFKNDLFPTERIPGKPTRNAPYNRTAARNISARQTEANKLNTTIDKVRRTKAAK